ncbi:MAG: glutathione S-transferase, partial [Pseudomonadota bacterium]
MKLYDGGRAPNPRRVSIYLAEKGIEVKRETIDMGALEHRNDIVSSLNPLKRLPVLEFDDGTVLTETIAICRYFEELNPDPPLFGRSALEKAQIEMWQRRIEFGLLLHVA